MSTNLTPPARTSIAPYSKLAIWGFVLAFFTPIVGVFLSHCAFPAIKRGERYGRGLAVWGLALNYVFIVLYPVIALLTIWFSWIVLITMFGAQADDRLGPIAFYATMF
ncbi:DUF4190 domain-containing protein [Cryobacterium suzukii]|uniref:DUF4190 domain-containing protein n=1 Tax=Cryobacterium suzukii TaxID=1259198 RepID=A0A4R9ACD7_9MICO|nr:DUF4190 domain-containing protein [Cryobacterium suzukii]TFD57388.1 DUF4190 domain-containing protein [Cryobacterium suzukii]